MTDLTNMDCVVYNLRKKSAYQNFLVDIKQDSQLYVRHFLSPCFSGSLGATLTRRPYETRRLASSMSCLPPPASLP